MIKVLRHIMVAAIIFACSTTAVALEPQGNGSITAVENQEPQIATGSQCIEITVVEEGSHEAAIYALTGQLVKHMSITEGTTHIDLKPGYYIVRIDGHSKRVVVK